ncbi:MAG: apolipoprotein N-acyltransferase [Deltaproteobacteria bacterium]|nr:apolipoprotein N-acyltransferase [Deltaproteobacteria bacterium]
MVCNNRVFKDCLLLLLGASLYTLAAPPYEWASAAWVALAPLFLVIREKTPRGAFLAGLVYGVLFCAGIAYWVYLAVAAYFPFPFPLDLVFTLLSYSFFVGSYTGLAAAFSCVLMRGGRPLLSYLFGSLGVPALWVVGEFARSSLFSGFSWELLGYTQYRYLPLIQIADLTGVYGVSFLLALSGYVVAEMWHYQQIKRQKAKGKRQKSKEDRELETPQSAMVPLPWLALGLFTTSLVVTLSYGTFRLSESASPPTTPPVRLALVQGQVPPAQRWKRVHYANTLFRYATLTRRGIGHAHPDLIVWPEFAVGFYLDREPPLRGQLGQFTKAMNAALLLGAPRVEHSETGERYYNSAYLLAPGGTLLDVYDKVRLLPFAEYRPLALPSLVPHNAEHPSDFTAGSRSTVFSLPQGNFGVLICYEATYPYLARRLVRNGAQFFVNLSNDTWLAGEAAAAQHFSMTVFRAVENRRALARVATAGITGFVDPFGRVSQLSDATENVVIGDILPRHQLSVYTRYGDWFVVSCGAWALMALCLAHRARQRTSTGVDNAQDAQSDSPSLFFVAGHPRQERQEAVTEKAR